MLDPFGSLLKHSGSFFSPPAPLLEFGFAFALEVAPALAPAPMLGVPDAFPPLGVGVDAGDAPALLLAVDPSVAPPFVGLGAPAAPAAVPGTPDAPPFVLDARAPIGVEVAADDAFAVLTEDAFAVPVALDASLPRATRTALEASLAPDAVPVALESWALVLDGGVGGDV